MDKEYIRESWDHRTIKAVVRDYRYQVDLLMCQLSGEVPGIQAYEGEAMQRGERILEEHVKKAFPEKGIRDVAYGTQKGLVVNLALVDKNKGDFKRETIPWGKILNLRPLSETIDEFQKQINLFEMQVMSDFREFKLSKILKELKSNEEVIVKELRRKYTNRITEKDFKITKSGVWMRDPSMDYCSKVPWGLIIIELPEYPEILQL